MTLDPHTCYQAIKSRDTRFDGRFFTGVLTTGIYCRPVCPATTPKQENVQFFACASAAEEAGFRPCLRCRPESSPGTPAWLGTSATVSRALRLMAEGILDEEGVEGLAGRLDIGPRHLRRLFKEHLGASPVAMAQTQRVHLAKKLIDETTLSMSQVAFSAGFSSIRRFNAAFRKIYGKAPSALRKRPRTASEKSHLQIKLSYRSPFDGKALLRFLRARAIPGVEQVEESSYSRTISLGDTSGIIRVEPLTGKALVHLLVPTVFAPHLHQIVERVRRLFDLKADPTAIADHLSQDARLAGLIDAYPGIRVPGAWDGFEIAVRAILGQQVSVKGANTLAGRLVEKYGDPLPQADAPNLSYLFPRPVQLVDISAEDLGLTSKRAHAIEALARVVGEGTLKLSPRAGLEETIASLIELPGIGPWTAHYIAMRALGEPDAFPASDLALRRAATEDSSAALTEAQLRKQAEAWRPWRAYAAMYLWHHYSITHS